ncbi:TPA: DNA methyltransferase [Clostridium perfringens]|uniref:DNA-methyltransferase n=1 Tax=Clostridium perfringens TaxID=1502 RepID=UPI001A9A952A|nr:DNA methyltransferase [Clostridium perfringens]ELC8414213.1 site-specific DNA-methyltransferase [Clostridium perfringens]MBO3335286.1 site-specific DNA-methyltransferase [Clostridium perfringens]MDM0608870.1 DNA methyltransferase [Clostridium perfringens]
MSKNNDFHINKLFRELNINNKSDLKDISKKLKVNVDELEYYNDKMIFPQGEVMKKILEYKGYSELELKLRLGIIDNQLIEWISKNPEIIVNNIEKENIKVYKEFEVKFKTEYGKLFKGDCLEVMKGIPDESVDLIFADPPFNLNKSYESGINDYVSEQEYILWTEKWVLECLRILSPGGAIFIYNLPYWNTYTANILNKYANFRHWISISMKGLLPVANKLQPEHYSLLYYVKDKRPKTFNKQRIPIQTCRHCGGEIRDYGGKKKKLNPSGLSISDIFMDINPVRHKKYKNREANELPVKLLHRIISLASNEGDVIFDPFGGSGTTYVVSEYLRRKWIGIEIGSIDDIINRFNDKSMDLKLLKEIDNETNVLFTNKQIKLREKNKFWGYEILD